MYFASGSCTTVLPPSKRRKAPKIAWIRCPSYFSQSLRVQQVAPTVSPVGSVGASALCAEVPETRTLCKGGKKVYLFYSARFSHFIDSLKLFFPFHNGFAKRFLRIFFKSIFYIGCSTNCVNRADKITEIINYFGVLFVHFDCFCKVFNTAS